MPPELTYEAFQADIQAQLGISRDQLGGVPHLAGRCSQAAAAGRRLPDQTQQGPAPLPDRAGCRRAPLGRSSVLARLDWLPGEARSTLSLPARPVRPGRPPPGSAWRRSRRLTLRRGRPARCTRRPAARAGAGPHPHLHLPGQPVIVLPADQPQRRRVRRRAFIEVMALGQVGGLAAVGEPDPKAAGSSRRTRRLDRRCR